MKLIVIDGQGGKMGHAVIVQLKKSHPELEITAIGTNSIATSSMLKAGADAGATGENPVVVASRSADIIIGPIGIVIPNSLLGEITPAMAEAIGSSQAKKILIPVNKCNHYVVGCEELPLSAYISQVVAQVEMLTARPPPFISSYFLVLGVSSLLSSCCSALQMLPSGIRKALPPDLHALLHGRRS